MALIQMKTGDTYFLSFTSIKRRNKQVNCQRLEGMCWVWDLEFKDKHGNVGKGETLTPNAEDCGFYLKNPNFNSDIWQEAKCIFVTAGAIQTPTIDPTEDLTGARKTGPMQIAQQVQQHLDTTKKPDPMSQERPLVNQYSAPISGKSYTFALAYAKDMMLKEIEKQPEGYRITDEDVRKTFHIADMINHDLVEKINF